MIHEVKNHAKANELFDDWEETIIWSCLENIMGHVYVNDIHYPTAAMAMLGDFCFLAGTPDMKMVSFKPEHCKQDFIIMVPQNSEWAECIECCYQEKARKIKRYAMKKEKDVFDIESLKEVVSFLPKDYKMQRIDELTFRKCKEIEWCTDLVSQYGSYKLYRKHGMGTVVLNAAGEIVSGASSYSGYAKGIEIEIDTREDYRRRGLAYVCGAKLILQCLHRNWYPSWDAQNKGSVALAEKLGYHFSHSYVAYEIWGY